MIETHLPMNKWSIRVLEKGDKILNITYYMTKKDAKKDLERLKLIYRNDSIVKRLELKEIMWCN